ncbi:4'-phosphopantetheinyl transferase superfamily protein [Bdellovibrio sp. NC01]|uniref:4'-phosphopantetheinyl transferase family protein n=1 Tax=Bdellovibrio sp. NC01 TaxID=2220073 RepID=UPI0011584D63|nr:4'-phosphopantetheinyl transferase superfamily protein [Bdellovibrio sp. NC01]QDK39394.1 hypothetical protein DOE51_18230 [Bdellovibrio sp. NC01]
MHITEDMLESFRKILNSPSLQIYAETNWGSHNPEHRTLIHEKLNALKSADPALHTSVSHTNGLGVIAACSSPIGVDAELTARVLPAIIARVSSPEELSQAPNAASLWSAKEATFKALKSYEQPSVVSKISIGEWQNIASQFETFRLMNASIFGSPSSGVGVVTHLPHHTLSFFVFCS